MSLSLMRMCSYRACGSICARALTLPFRPSTSGHWMTRRFACGNCSRTFSTRASAGSVRVVHAEQQLVLRIIERAMADECREHVRVSALERFQNADRGSEIARRQPIEGSRTIAERCPDAQDEICRPGQTPTGRRLRQREWRWKTRGTVQISRPERSWTLKSKASAVSQDFVTFALGQV